MIRLIVAYKKAIIDIIKKFPHFRGGTTSFSFFSHVTQVDHTLVEVAHIIEGELSMLLLKISELDAVFP